MATPPIRKHGGVRAMGKQARDRRLADNEAGAQGRNIRTSPQKLNLVAQAIRGKDVESAGDRKSVV